MKFVTGAQQLPLGPAPQNPYSRVSFVPHSGVALALEMIQRRIDEVSKEPQTSAVIVLYGAEGSGKTHLLHLAGEIAEMKGLPSTAIHSVELDRSECVEENDVVDWASFFVSSYDQQKRNGGVFIASTATNPSEVKNPHIRSRLLAGDVVKLSYPQEEELRPLLLSLLERRNLKLPDTTLEYIVKRLPLSPLSFANIFAKIDEFSSATNRPAKLGLVREVVEQRNPKHHLI